MACAQRGMYCGNDYIAAGHLSRRIIDNVMEQTERLGTWLGSLGYRGLFGLDFVIDSSESSAYAVDLNPRWQGSTVLLTLAEYKAGRLPLAVAELACRLNQMSEQEVLRHNDEFREPVSASHVSLRCRTTSWWRVTGSLRPGVYTPSREPAFVRPGLRLNDLDAPTTEMLVAGGVPRPGALLAPGSHALRFSSERQVIDLSCLGPLAWSQAAAEGLYGSLALEPVVVD